jgi:hypothetical protein
MFCLHVILQVSQLEKWSQERAAAAAAAAASVAAERAAQQLLAGLKAADAEAQEQLEGLCKCIEDAAAQVSQAMWLRPMRQHLA